MTFSSDASDALAQVTQAMIAIVSGQPATASSPRPSTSASTATLRQCMPNVSQAVTGRYRIAQQISESR